MITRLSLALLCLTSSLVAENWLDYYKVETVPTPENVNPQLGGVTTLSDGRIVACFYSGEVMIYDSKAESWSKFAQGLHCPLGVLEDGDGSLLVMQWSELTRLKDTDGDGVADHYQTVTDDFGITGNYHEFAYGPVRDSKGNLYISLNVASNQLGIFKDVRGPFSEIGLNRGVMENGKRNSEEWKKRKGEAGRMYSRVPYRGCILQITPAGETKCFAYGLRSPDGLGVDEQDRLWVTDNQGDWRGTSPLYHVEEGGFYGHPASLIWKEGWTRDPLKVPVKELEQMRTKAAGLFPHGELANSPTQPIPTIDSELFGLPKGELLIGEMNQPLLIRFLKDEVGGVMQGTAIPFLFSLELGMGSHRLTYSNDGTLWIGKTHLKWAGQEGMRKVTWNGKLPFLVNSVRLEENGFSVSFNQELGEADPVFSVKRHTYEYGPKYGSPKIDEAAVEVLKTQVANNRRSVELALPEIKEGYLYTIEIENGETKQGQALMDKVLRYNVVRVLGGEGKKKASQQTSNSVDLLGDPHLSLWRSNKKKSNEQTGQWSLSAGVLSRGHEKAGSLSTKKKYKDFDLQFEFKISEEGNSGIIYRAKGRGLEYQLLDDVRHVRGKEPKWSTAAIYDLYAPVEGKVYYPAGKWNSGRIIAKGNHIEHWLNGKKVLEAEIGSETWNTRFLNSKNKDIKIFGTHSSPIQLQDHGADVHFRNVLISEL